VLTTLLLTDLVDSTRTAARIGEIAWRDRLSRHYDVNRAALDRNGGREIGTTGDGMLATFSTPAAAAADEVLVSELVRTFAGGSGLSFEDRGERRAEGGREPRRLFAVAAARPGR
jgi:class 3 adenylate cyclase